MAVWGCLEGFATDGTRLNQQSHQQVLLLVAWRDQSWGEELEESSHKEFHNGNKKSLGTEPD